MVFCLFTSTLCLVILTQCGSRPIQVPERFNFYSVVWHIDLAVICIKKCHVSWEWNQVGVDREKVNEGKAQSPVGPYMREAQWRTLRHQGWHRKSNVTGRTWTTPVLCHWCPHTVPKVQSGFHGPLYKMLQSNLEVQGQHSDQRQ